MAGETSLRLLEQSGGGHYLIGTKCDIVHPIDCHRKAGQRKFATRANGDYWHYQYDAMGQVTSAQKHLADKTDIPGYGFGYAYDADGNLTGDGRWIYTWNGDGAQSAEMAKPRAQRVGEGFRAPFGRKTEQYRLIAMEPTAAAVALGLPNRKLEFVYDYQGRRVQKAIKDWNSGMSAWGTTATESLRFFYDGWNLIVEIDQNDLEVREHVWGLDLAHEMIATGGVGALLATADANGTYYAAYDGNGNITAMVDSLTAFPVAEYEYGPFGQPLRATGPLAADLPYGFSTKYTDAETGLVYYGYRYYYASLGRWLSRDPIGEGGGMNLISVDSNDLINSWDYLGKWIIKRNSKIPYAKATAEIGDTWQSLAKEARLSANEYLKWVQYYINGKLVRGGESPRAGCSYRIPNTAYIMMGQILFYDKNDEVLWTLSMVLYTKFAYVIDEYREMAKLRNNYIVYELKAGLEEFKSAIRDPYAQSIYWASHGSDGRLNGYDDASFNASHAWGTDSHQLANLWLYTCFASEDATNKSGWISLVSEYGTLRAAVGGAYIPSPYSLEDFSPENNEN